MPASGTPCPGPGGPWNPCACLRGARRGGGMSVVWVGQADRLSTGPQHLPDSPEPHPAGEQQTLPDGAVAGQLYKTRAAAGTDADARV